ncbi:PBSX family phage terminase large subunit [Thermocatellispora tengchongensis]|uniref:PBSX family phage terminase large subunit n=1 Tax=Thermocatellispora tengchongensis TaxID=1073253 RepID=A0A840PKB7_9ACTN|nr:PBSX family phage terminase large subunit [Thermocatellispora tengchongensis]MBB5139968.1 PBSX family phage terminase large subunit [Thermocatellispora tengchongensis]
MSTPAPSPLTLSPKQERSIAESTARLNIWSGAIRSGKTIASLLRWLIYIAQAPRGGSLVIVGKTSDTIARNVFDPLTDPAITGPVARRIIYTRGAPTANILGRRVEIISSNDARSENRLRGMTCAGAYVDEATLIEREFWDQLLARLSVKDAKLFATTNPDAPNHWLKRQFLDRRHELDLRHWHFTLDDNKALDPAYVKALKAEYQGLWYKRFILGQWVMAEGAIYDMFDPDRHVVDVLPPMERWLTLGIDYGTVNPFDAILVGVSTPDNTGQRRIYLASEFRWDSRAERRQLTDAEYSQKLTDWLDNIPDTYGPGTRGVRPQWVVVDPSAASFITQLHRDGFTPTMGDNSVNDGIRTVSNLLGADHLRVHRSVSGFLDEVGSYAWDDKRAEKGEDVPVKVDDHALDATRYALHTTQAAWLPLLQPVF